MLILLYRCVCYSGPHIQKITKAIAMSHRVEKRLYFPSNVCKCLETIQWIISSGKISLCFLRCAATSSKNRQKEYPRILKSFKHMRMSNFHKSNWLAGSGKLWYIHKQMRMRIVRSSIFLTILAVFQNEENSPNFFFSQEQNLVFIWQELFVSGVCYDNFCKMRITLLKKNNKTEP